MTSPTQLTLRSLRKDGYLCEITEKWNQWARIRRDLWGFCDVLGIRDNEILAVQCTSDSNVSARVKKIADHENVGAVRKAGIRIVVHGWKKVKNRWQLRTVDCS